jgi:hypothetical protein
MKKLYFYIIVLILAIIAVSFDMTVLQNKQASDFQANITIEDILEKATEDLSKPAAGTIKANELEAKRKEAEKPAIEGPQQNPNGSINIDDAITSFGETLPSEIEGPQQNPNVSININDAINNFGETLPSETAGPQPNPNGSINIDDAINRFGETLPTEAELQAKAEADAKKLAEAPGFSTEFLPRGPENPTDIIYNIVDVIFIAAGILAVIFMIIASIQAIVNFGEEEAISKAKKMFMYTGAGLVIIILSYAAVTNIIRYLFLEG